MNDPKENPNMEASNTTTAAPSPNTSMDHPTSQPAADPAAGEANHNGYHLGKLESALPVSIPHVTLRTVFMALLVAMGGFIFGYDTGQISGFLEMQVFLERFGEPGPVTSKNPTGYHFSNVRSGLIVALVSSITNYAILVLTLYSYQLALCVVVCLQAPSQTRSGGSGLSHHGALFSVSVLLSNCPWDQAACSGSES